MREVVGVPDRDFVTHRKTGKRVKAGDITTATKSLHQQEAETAKAELAKIKAKLGLHGIDLDSLPDKLPGAEAAKIDSEQQVTEENKEENKEEKLAKIKAAKEAAKKG